MKRAGASRGAAGPSPAGSVAGDARLPGSASARPAKSTSVSTVAEDRREVTKRELAGILGLSTRQIENLEAEGLPRRADKNRKFYPIPDAVRWYVDRERRRAEPTDFEEARARKMAAEARLAELMLAREEGKLLAIDDVEREWRQVLERLRAKLLSVPSRYAPALVGRRSIPEAIQVLQQLVEETMLALSETGEEIDAGDDPDDAGGAG